MTIKIHGYTGRAKMLAKTKFYFIHIFFVRSDNTKQIHTCYSTVYVLDTTMFTALIKCFLKPEKYKIRWFWCFGLVPFSSEYFDANYLFNVSISLSALILHSQQSSKGPKSSYPRFTILHYSWTPFVVSTNLPLVSFLGSLWGLVLFNFLGKKHHYHRLFCKDNLPSSVNRLDISKDWRAW